MLTIRILRSYKGNTSHKKNRFLSGIAQITSPSPPPNSGKLYNFFRCQKRRFARMTEKNADDDNYGNFDDDYDN